MVMHPVIRIITLLLVAGFVVWGGWPQLGLALSLLVFGFIAISEARLGQGLRLLLRLRWLFVSILLVYLWFTPGIPLFGVDAAWMPSEQGVVSGAHRVLCLMVLMLAVSLLLQLTPIEALIGALLWLLYPLSFLGFAHERLAVRIALTMEAVKELDGWYQARLQPVDGFKARVKQWAMVLIDLFEHVTVHAGELPERVISVPVVVMPSLFQWLIPMVLGGVMLVL